MNVFLKTPNGAFFEGVVWPDVTMFPDWYHPNATAFWIEQFVDNFDPESGIDIDGIWIDINEPASMCKFPCEDPLAEARRLGMPPEPPPLREPPRSLPNFTTSSPNPDSVFESQAQWLVQLLEVSQNYQRQHKLGTRGPTYPEADNHLLHPPYNISNGGPSGQLSDLTVPTNVRHANGLLEYDIHNLYGMMMSMATHQAMLHRRPLLRPFIITRSTFAGVGRYVQKWLGDNASRWDHYRSSIAGMLGFAAIFQIPMVGSDVCGFELTPTPELCAHWTTLGAFIPFFRNHAHDEAPPQEFYLWPLVTSAAKHAISLRYRLLDYLYRALYAQSLDSTPAINPMWYLYPSDPNTFAIDLMTDENATDVHIYLPDDVFYDLETGEAVRGRGEYVHLRCVPFDRIPLHVRGGCVVPMRVESANTTTELRKKAFELLVAPGLDRTAAGMLYVDDGVSLTGSGDRLGLRFRYDGDAVGISPMEKFHADEEGLPDRMEKAGIRIARTTIMGQEVKGGLSGDHLRQ
ncbi:Uu.00g000630.m01.CDS01 [Anthostomella pinea]|uniref:alpha-glucosidase n=1 Tax=Anthostomella pinea TaxID=933095 RepID=A0AAI8VJ53_9PEZI|nr:Uu.00g000630.m01.CDS01 [Anthostomella pinea]